MPYFPCSCISFIFVSTHLSLSFCSCSAYEDSQIANFLGSNFSSVSNYIHRCNISIGLKINYDCLQKDSDHNYFKFSRFGSIYFLFIFFFFLLISYFFLHSLSLLLKLHNYEKIRLWEDVICILKYVKFSFQRQEPAENISKHLSISSIHFNIFNKHSCMVHLG